MELILCVGPLFVLQSERIQKVLAYVNEVHLMCSILGLDFGKTVSAVHPSLHDKRLEHATNISDNTLEGLENTILKLKTETKVRFEKLKDIVTSLFELWNIMNTRREEKQHFSRVTSIIRVSEAEVVEPGYLSAEVIQQPKCFVFCVLGLVDPGELLAKIEAQISEVSNAALSRKEIMDRIDRWLSACEEDIWLEDYNMDQNRFSGGTSAHISLKRAERARITIKKIPCIYFFFVYNMISIIWLSNSLNIYDQSIAAIVDNLICRTARLVTILEEYKLSRIRKEEEKRRLRVICSILFLYHSTKFPSVLKRFKNKII
ncbi:putative microtubule-associated protein, MAP65/Ase1/PRC1 [Helianthus annuus]|nr:putative microtubule-associated protein, MAP65/Ase1/PRC1 [Helianthus annuus]